MIPNVSFTIQNVPIKLQTAVDTSIKEQDLQYKMFLLNLCKIQYPNCFSLFTIQNVPIKLDNIEKDYVLDKYLQYKMFLLNRHSCLFLEQSRDIYNTKCSY